MPTALISDIHGNAAALDAVLAKPATFGVEDGIVPGDVAPGGDEPAAVLDRLAELGWPVILGNADAWLLDADVEHADGPAIERRAWTLAQLGDRHLGKIRAFPCSPGSYDDILFPDTEDLSPWDVEGFDLLAGGHTHVQHVRRIGDAVYVNPGSVGVPVYRWNDRRPLPHAEYAILDGCSVEFRRCVY